MFTIMIASNQPIIRYGLSSILEKTEDFAVIAMTNTVTEMQTQYDILFPDLIILDMRILIRNDLSLCSQIMQKRPILKIVVFTDNDKDIYLWKAWIGGAKGVISIQETEEDFLIKVREASLNKYCFTLSHMQRIARWQNDIEKRFSALTSRENDILYLIVRGKRNREIAASLSLSQSTVEKHINSLLGKINVPCCRSLMAMIMQFYVDEFISVE